MSVQKEKSLFVVCEDENQTEEIINVGEDDIRPIIMSPENSEEPEDTDWRTSKHPKHFVTFLIKEINRIPKPGDVRGNKSALEKLHGQLAQLDSFISQALRKDYDDEVDVSKVDEIRRMVEKHKDEVQDALDGMEMMSKQKRQMRSRRADEEEGDLVKEATTPHMNGMQTQISAFERAVVGAIINGAISGGRNIEELYASAKEKYKFTPREELALLQILEDFGYAINRDRLRVGDKDGDPTREDNLGEWQSQYFA